MSSQWKWQKLARRYLYEPLCFCVSLPLLGLLFIVYCITQPSRNRRTDNRNKQRSLGRQLMFEPEEHSSLPSERPRRLTNQRDQSLQLQSTLMTKLPSELRLIIWEHVLDRRHEQSGQKKVVHLDVGDGILRYVLCMQPEYGESFGRKHVCWRYMSTKRSEKLWQEENDPNIVSKWTLNPLLLTCKFMFVFHHSLHRYELTKCQNRYSEAITILYQNPIFDVRRAVTIERMHDIMLPQRLQSIRSIRYSALFDRIIRKGITPTSSQMFIYTFDYYNKSTTCEDEARWPTACRILASLRNLAELRICMTFKETPHEVEQKLDHESMTFLLDHLKPVRAQKFLVILTEALPEGVITQLDQVPFTIQYEIEPERFG